MREIAFGVAFSLFVAVTAFAIAAWPVPGRPVASYFPSSIPTEQAVLAIGRAGGQLMDVGSGASVVISLGSGSGYALDLYRAGAWFVIDASFARLCGGFWQAKS